MEDKTQARPADQRPVLAAIVLRLVQVYRPERIYWFGLSAGGDASPDSDCGLMVAVPDGTPKEVRDTKEVFRALADIRASVDVLVWTRRESDERLHLPASFPSTIVREGKLLYAA